MEVASVNDRESKQPQADMALYPPAFHALLIQVAALVLSLFIFSAAKFIFNFVLPAIPLLLFHSIFASALSLIRGMDWWWVLIEFIFPPAVVASLLFGLSASFSFFAFVLMLLLFWSTFRTQVPYFPSKSNLPPIILELLPPTLPFSFVDIGSGLGGLLIDLKKLRPESRFEGVEIAPLPWVISLIRVWLLRSDIKLRMRDYVRCDFSQYDVVFAYLSPAVMPGLWEKARSEMRSGAMLMSYEFIIPDVPPDMEINTGENSPVLYVWRI
ncbi:class I SAM-dependent methyltransferase [Undibacterium sp. SXout7W]|uniref:class I SAM-dependent methyltransferase n=1 Tax=Undibacterium sp. SXout7W TaxID=3413049 RepID=UPI003BF43847